MASFCNDEIIEYPSNTPCAVYGSFGRHSTPTPKYIYVISTDAYQPNYIFCCYTEWPRKNATDTSVVYKNDEK